jgi:hypothetical protein
MSHKFPAPVNQNGRMFLWRSHLEAHKKKLAGLPFEVDPQPDALVTAAQAAVEFGVCRRTIGRRVLGLAK